MKTSLFAFLIVALVGISTAESDGVIEGEVLDASTGKPLAGVNVMISGTDLGAATNPSGYYAIHGVSPGTHTIIASMIGFEDATRRNIRLDEGRRRKVTFYLEPTVLRLRDETLVTGQRPLLTRDVAQHTVTIREKEMKRLPGVTRVEEVLEFQPNIVRDAELDELHLRGGRGGEILYLVDGMPVNDRLVGGESGIDVPVCEIERIEIITGGFNAEYGEAQSGLVNLITKRNPLPLLGEISYKAGRYAVSGGEDHYGSLILQIPVGNVSCLITGYADMADTYAPTGRPRSIKEVLGLRVQERQENHLGISSRLLFRPSARTSLAVSMRAGERWFDKYRHRWSEIPDHTYLWERESSQWSAQWSQALGRGTSYSLRVGGFRTSQHYNPGKTPPELYALEQLFIWQQAHGMNPEDRGQPFDPDGDWFYEMGYDTTWHHHITKVHTLRGSFQTDHFPEHELKMGGEVSYCDLYQVEINGGWWFDEDWMDVSGPWPGYGWDRDFYHVYPHFGSLYLQDRFRAEELIFNLGLRLDYFHVGNQVSADRTMRTYVSPRIGLSYPFSSKSVLHLSYGHFHQMPEYQYIYMKPLYRGNLRLVGNPDLGPEWTTAYELRLEHLVTPSVLASVIVYKKDIRDLVDGERIGTSPFYSYQLANSSYGDVTALEFSLVAQGNRYVDGQAAYTLAKAVGKTSKDLESFQEWELPSALGEYPLIWDQRHSIYFRANVRSPDAISRPLGTWLAGWEASLLWRVGSGLPYTSSSQAHGLAKNSLRLPWTSVMDLKIQRSLTWNSMRFSGLLEIANLWNRNNVRKVDTTPSWALSDDPTRTDPTAFSARRQITLGIELSY